MNIAISAAILRLAQANPPRCCFIRSSSSNRTKHSTAEKREAKGCRCMCRECDGLFWRFGLEVWGFEDGTTDELDRVSAAEQETPIRSRLEICKRLESLPLSSHFNRAFSIRNSVACDSRFVARVGNHKIAKNLRLENCSLVILMGLTRNSNSRFAISRPPHGGQGFWRRGIGGWRLEGTAVKGSVQAVPSFKRRSL